MHLDPLLPDAGHSSFRQPACVQRPLDDAGAGHPPISAMTARGFVNLRRVDAQADEVAPPSTGALPLFPVVHAHPPPQPLVHLRYLSIGLADTEVVQPSHHVAPQLAYHAIRRDAAAATGDGLYSFLEPRSSLLRPYDLTPANLKAEKGAVR